MQDATLDALRSWPVAGLPDRPGAWLLVTARRRAIDRLRRDRVGADKLRRLTSLEPDTVAEDIEERFDQPSIRDDELGLLFACCHPSLAREARVPLTLRAVCGLTTHEIARLLVIPEPTVAQRIVRAKRKIRSAGIPLALPDGAELWSRLPSVLNVVYLLFTEGYAPTPETNQERGLVRTDLIDESIRLARLLAALSPDDPEVLGLLSLLLLTDARRAARFDGDGRIVALEDHDRTRWRSDLIEEGLAVLERASHREAIGPYQLQAAIAAIHDRAAHTGSINWDAIVMLYDSLVRLDESPHVALNRAVAIGMSGDLPRARAEVSALEDRLDETHVLHAAAGYLAERAGERDAAIEEYSRAVELAAPGAERDHLADVLDHLHR